MVTLNFIILIRVRQFSFVGCRMSYSVWKGLYRCNNCCTCDSRAAVASCAPSVGACAARFAPAAIVALTASIGECAAFVGACATLAPAQILAAHAPTLAAGASLVATHHRPTITLFTTASYAENFMPVATSSPRLHTLP